MSRRQQVSAVLSGVLILLGIFILVVIATSTAGRVAGIFGILSGLFNFTVTIVESRRGRRRDAAPVVRDPRSPAE